MGTLEINLKIPLILCFSIDLSVAWDSKSISTSPSNCGLEDLCSRLNEWNFVTVKNPNVYGSN